MAGRKTETGQAAVQENLTEALSVTASENAAEESQETEKEKSWIVKITNNPGYCGGGAGGIQFANGQAFIKSERMAAWFKEHKGYKVAEQ